MVFWGNKVNAVKNDRPSAILRLKAVQLVLIELKFHI